MVFDLAEILRDMEAIKWSPEDKYARADALERLSTINQYPSNSLKRSKTLHKQLEEFMANVKELTFITVNGLSIQSSFAIQMRIKVQGVLGIEVSEKNFPVVIRSRSCGKYLVDTEA